MNAMFIFRHSDSGFQFVECSPMAFLLSVTAEWFSELHLSEDEFYCKTRERVFVLLLKTDFPSFIGEMQAYCFYLFLSESFTYFLGYSGLILLRRSYG